MRLYTTARCGDAHRTVAVFQKLASLIQSQSAKIIIGRMSCALLENCGKIASFQARCGGDPGYGKGFVVSLLHQLQRVIYRVGAGLGSPFISQKVGKYQADQALYFQMGRLFLALIKLLDQRQNPLKGSLFGKGTAGRYVRLRHPICNVHSPKAEKIPLSGALRISGMGHNIPGQKQIYVPCLYLELNAVNYSRALSRSADL